MEEILDKDYFNDEEILSAFHPRHRAKVETLLGAISSVIAYTPEGTLVVHGEPLEESSIVELLHYELYNRQPPWMRGAIFSLINCHLNLTAFRARHYRPTVRTDFAPSTFLTRFRFRRDGNKRITGVLESSDGENVATGAYGGLPVQSVGDSAFPIADRASGVTIGHLKRSFHCLHTELKVLPECCYTTPVACCVMHNIAQHYSCEDGNCHLPPGVLLPPSPPEADGGVAQWRAILSQHCCGKAVCWASKLVVDKGVLVSMGLVVLVALSTAAVLPQAEGAPHPRPAVSPKAGNLSFPGLRHLEENDPGGHKDLVAKGPTFWAKHPMCRMPSLRAVCWASRLVVDEVVPAGLGPVVPVALQQQLLPQAVPLPLEEAPPAVAE
ncbi:hypothetical protein HPB47_017569 [Ixodes persulcatus]|uniref:Uncharacterized protein n=1 Tax=Ixodes persulcatus TaxID=34615 RepID=A0AC60QQA9_IXOPE|nr:hypothetical protein HPB47_017569 [Ixodes persulcatus]